MNEAYLEAAGIHRVQRDVIVNSNPPQGPHHLKETSETSSVSTYRISQSVYT